MQSKRGKILSLKMILFEMRNTTGNPYVHIFGVIFPIFLVVIFSHMLTAEITDSTMLSMALTSLFLGMGPIIPMATVLMGYGASKAQEEEKGIPQRMELFGIKPRESLCNRAASEAIFMVLAFSIYFVFGFLFLDIKTPVASGVILYIVCILLLGIIFFCIAHAIATIFKKFGIVYCISMSLYFVIMVFSGMMGINYDSMSGGMQAVAKLLPTTYINKDFYAVWMGESYNFVPMVQSYLLFAAVAGILTFVTVKRGARNLH